MHLLLAELRQELNEINPLMAREVGGGVDANPQQDIPIFLGNGRALSAN